MLTSDKLIKSDKLYVGIDQSLSCTSVCLFQNGTLDVYRIKPDMTGPKRLKYIYDKFVEILDGREISGLAIEGYAFNAKGLYFNLGEVGGVLRLAMMQGNYLSVQVPPTTLKKFVTGSGKSTKAIMMKELYKRFDIDTNDDNDCDAIGLAMLAREYFETEYHLVVALRSDLHKACVQIIGDHPMQLNLKEYLADMPDDMVVYEYERLRKGKKKVE